LIAWDGTTSYFRDISGFVSFGFVFETRTAIATDAVFNIQYANASDADPCLPDTFQPVEEISICDRPANPGPQATVTIPAGTLAGTICAGTIPCKPGKFILLVSASGDTANVLATMSFYGPKR
jgi:hypothetical protein